MVKRCEQRGTVRQLPFTFDSSVPGREGVRVVAQPLHRAPPSSAGAGPGGAFQSVGNGAQERGTDNVFHL